MAKYCGEDCEKIGSICDFCKHYKDDSELTGGKFEGEGICAIKNVRTDALDSCDDDFYCSLIDKK